MHRSHDFVSKIVLGAGGKAKRREAVVDVPHVPKNWPTPHLGFRTLNFTYRGPLARFNTSMNGPILSAGYHF
ncbi:MAG TPA: hypothetical protein VE309_05065 [Caulobacteraceae bacterium]|nr:hypothetical protein [Caulobacteraceae bacterium]